MKKLIQASFWISTVALATPQLASAAFQCIPGKMNLASLQAACPKPDQLGACTRGNDRCASKFEYQCATAAVECGNDLWKELKQAKVSTKQNGATASGGAARATQAQDSPASSNGGTVQATQTPGSTISFGPGGVQNSNPGLAITLVPNPQIGQQQQAAPPPPPPAADKRISWPEKTFADGKAIPSKDQSVTVPGAMLGNRGVQGLVERANTAITNGDFEAFQEANQQLRGKIGEFNTSNELAASLPKQTAEAAHDPGARRSEDMNDECSTSAAIDKRYKCAGAKGLVTTGQIMNQAGQVAGSVGTQIAGTQAQNAAMSEGTQSATLEGAAKTQKMAAMSQLGVGGVNFMMGMMQMMRGKRHKGYANEIEKGIEGTAQSGDAAIAPELYTLNQGDMKWNKGGGQNNVAQGIYDMKRHESARISAEINVNNAKRQVAQADAAYQAAQADPLGGSVAIAKANLDNASAALKKAVNDANAVASDAGRNIGMNARNEQLEVGQNLNDAGLMSMMMAAQQITQGTIGMATAKNLSDAAKKIKDAEQGLNIAPGGQDPFPTTDPRGATVVTGDGSNPGEQSGATETPQTDDGTAPLGTGLPPVADDSMKAAAPTPGAFVPGGSAGGAGGGGGGGGLGGGSTQPASPEGEKGPMAANSNVGESKPKDSAPGLPNAGIPAGRENSINPADMMAAALGLFKKEQETGNPSSQFYDASRGLASGGMGGIGMPDEDIFKIIEDGYKTQIKAGNI